MSDYGGWAPYIPVAERRRKAERAVAKLRKKGHSISPITINGRLIATTFWGKAWCTNIEGYRDYESRLPRGRSYVRNGSVIDLQIAPGRVTATVSGSELYKVTITVKQTAQTAWHSICTDCAGNIDSMVELLQGRFSKAVMERLCHQQTGLFPRPSEIQFICSCPDYASMCKHVAAVLYGVGARLDQQPELLFRLRAVNEADLLARIDTAMLLPEQAPASSRILAADDVSALFGLDMEAPEVPSPAVPVRRKGAKTKAAVSDAVQPSTDREKSTRVRATAKRAPERTAPIPARSVTAGEQPTTTKTVATRSSRSAKAPPDGKARKSTTVSNTVDAIRAATTRTRETGASSRQGKSASGAIVKPTSVRVRNRAPRSA